MVRLLAAALLGAAVALLTNRPRRRSGVRLAWEVLVRESDTPRPPTGCPQTIRHHERGIDVATTITTTQEVEFKIEFKDRKGQPAPVDGTPEWMTDNTDVVHLHPAADGLSCRVVANGMPGSAQVQVTADVHIGEQVESLVGTGGVSVIPAQATRVELIEGEVKESDDTDGPPVRPPVKPPAPPSDPWPPRDTLPPPVNPPENGNQTI